MLYRHPNRLSPIDPSPLQATRAAEEFAGLPPTLPARPDPGCSQGRGPRLGLAPAPRLVHTIDWLFRFTQPQDWETEARPIVWPSAAMQQDALGLSETQVKVLNRAFIEAGLITMKDGPNGKRYSKRDSEGCIIEASGFDLSPLAARYAGLIHLVAAAKAERAEMTQLEAENASSSIANSPTAALLEGYLDTPERYLGSYELSNSLKPIFLQAIAKNCSVLD